MVAEKSQSRTFALDRSIFHASVAPHQARACPLTVARKVVATALRQIPNSNGRIGSLASFWPDKTHVRFAPESVVIHFRPGWVPGGVERRSTLATPIFPSSFASGLGNLAFLGWGVCMIAAAVRYMIGAIAGLAFLAVGAFLGARIKNPTLRAVASWPFSGIGLLLLLLTVLDSMSGLWLPPLLFAWSLIHR